MTENPLFHELQIGSEKLKNRFVVAPMTRASADKEGVPGSKMCDYYESMARGGFAAIITEGTYTDLRESKALSGQPGIVTEAQINSWKKITDAVHKHGSLAICQLMHGGALSVAGWPSLAPSPVQPDGWRMTGAGSLQEAYPIPKEMTLADVNFVVKTFVQAALAARMAGFDGVEIHAANGYLLDQFITPHTNLRTDAYGGSMENRFRIVAEIISAVREQLPSGFILGLRVSESKVNNLSYRWPQGAVFAKDLFTEVSKCDLSYLHIAAEGGNWERECRYQDGSSSNSIAKKITRFPVIANGGMHDIQKAQFLLETGHADLFSIGRAAIADPEWVNKIANKICPVPFEKRMIRPMFTLENTAHFFKEKKELK